MNSIFMFNYFTGFGIGQISPHTIHFYPIKINGKGLGMKELIQKAKIKAGKLVRYNDCYRIRDTIPVVHGKRIGICFLKDEEIFWEGETLYWKPSVIAITPCSPFTLPPCQYPHSDNHWTANFCAGGRVIQSQQKWDEYVREYFNRRNEYEQRKLNIN